MIVSEPILIVVGIGTLGFTLAASNMLAAEAKRVLDLRGVQCKAVTLRNNYARQLLAIRADPVAAACKTIPLAMGTVPARAA